MLSGFACNAVLLLAAALVATGCGRGAADQDAVARLANPASENCIAQGGRHTVEQAPNGGEYGVCLFEDNRQCEEWALLRGACRVGGLRITGYATPAARYCAITGGTYAITANSGAPAEQGTCALPTGRTCDAAAYHRGECGP